MQKTYEHSSEERWEIGLGVGREEECGLGSLCPESLKFLNLPFSWVTKVLDIESRTDMRDHLFFYYRLPPIQGNINLNCEKLGSHPFRNSLCTW